MLTVIMSVLTFLVLSAWIGTLLGLTLVFLMKVAKIVVRELYN